MPDTSRPVACPHCASRYLLPEELLGAAGARVKCPRCGEGFVVPPVPAAESEPGPPDASTAPVPDAVAVAFELIEAFASGREEKIAKASREGRFFGEYGAEILAVYDDYKQRMGQDAKATLFRQLLKDRWGVDLTPPSDPGD